MTMRDMNIMNINNNGNMFKNQDYNNKIVEYET